MLLLRWDMHGSLQVDDKRDKIYQPGKTGPGQGVRKSCYCRTNNIWEMEENGNCVGVTMCHMLEHYKVFLGARGLYTLGQALDDVPLPHYGTTVRGVCKGLMRLGIVSEYAWVREKHIGVIKHWISEHGPVVVCTGWWSGMEDTDSGGYVRVYGEYQDRHCWLVDGYGKRGFRGKNTLGRLWGVDGRFWLVDEDLERLLKEDNAETVLIRVNKEGIKSSKGKMGGKR